MKKAALVPLIRAALILGSFWSLSAQALQVVIWDTQLQTKLGYGEVSGSRLNLQLVQDYTGPVVALFSRDADEKDMYPGLASRYDGTLKGGQLVLNDLPISRFLSSYKLSVSLQSAAKTLSLPGLKTPPGKDNNPGNGNGNGNGNNGKNNK
ncbi:hypothetical protein [Deinococcus sonorensis]|uniref:CHRD domain-containing protein n=2 Tax=Deinococcus sonorensis TaxID=309891 RepID=A0AAU7UCK1_9DEIO